MDRSFDAPPPRRQPLLQPDGQWNQSALAAWLRDPAAFKAAMPDDTLAELGIRAGDLLITDDTAAFVAGGLILVTEEEIFFQYVGRVGRDSAGRPCFDLDGEMLALEGKASPFGLALMIVGYLSMNGRQEPPTMCDLVRARALAPAARGLPAPDRPITDIDQSQLPY